MSHSYTKIWIHLIFGTKNRNTLIKYEFEKDLYSHIIEHVKSDFDTKIKIINGTSDHIHILMLLNPNYSVSEITKNIKGESSHWINSNDFTKIKFAWQTGYGAFSVSESQINAVENYIKNQKEHHKKITFREEYELFMKKYGLKIINP
jgi:putative transposase